MKYIVFCFSIVVLMLSSCKKDYLDRAPLDEYSELTYWSTESDAIRFASRIYENLPTAESFICYEGMSDNALAKTASWGNTLRNAKLIGNSTQVPTTGGLDAEWDYNIVRHCFEFFRDVDKVEALDAGLKERLIAEVKTGLAYRYFIMATLYRDIPLVMQVFTDPKDADVPQVNKEVVIDQVVQWLDEAASVLPLSYGAADRGRFTKGAALALKARVLLYNNRFEEAAETANEVINSGAYSLYDNYYEAFQEEGDFSPEDILSYIYIKESHPNGLNDILGINSVSGGTLYLNPLPTLVDDYESINGYYPYSNDPSYDAHRPYANRDPRLAATIYYPGSTLANNDLYDPINNTLDKIGADKSSYTGYAFKKMWDKTDRDNRDNGGNDWRIIRYAEVLLIYAEAENEVNGATAEVIAAIDKIRSRAGMPGVGETFMINKWSINKETMRDFIRHERRIELAGEGHRYFDILRWKIGEQVLQGPVYTLDASAGLADIENTGGKTNSYRKAKLEDRYFNNLKFYVWPIPQGVLDRSGVLQQHAEWK